MFRPIQYPQGDDYANALGNMKRCLRDMSLHDFVPESDAKGDPKVRTGGLAYVFKLEHPTTSVAIKFFKSDDEERANRYAMIDQHLHTLSCPYLVGFQYQPRGLKWLGEHYPLLRMDWVGGKPLFNWMADWGATPNRNAAALRSMADRWVALIQALAANRIAHGDLQHGNVLVNADGSLVLVDYDGMCVPAMVAAKMKSQECGLPAYQHPQRPGQMMGLEMDDFSAWVVWLTLRGLAADPGLWDRHNQILDSNLLFSAADLQAPHESALWKELRKSRDAEVCKWAEVLFESLRKPIEEVPRFRFDPLDDLVAESKKPGRDWLALAALADAVLATGRALPLGPAHEARSRRDSLDRLRQAIDSGDGARIMTAYEPALVDDWPACQSLVAEAKRLLTTQATIAELKAALERTPDGRDFLLLWEKHKTLPEAAPFRPDAERWKKRLDALTKVETTLARRASEAEIASAWNELERAGGHPAMPATEPRLALARERVALLAKLRAVPSEEGEEADRQLRAVWDDGPLRGWAEVERYRVRWESAETRLEALGGLQQLLASKPQGPIEAHYERVGQAAALLPEGYLHAKAAMVRFVRQWLTDRDILAAACDRGDREAVVRLASKLSPMAESLEDRVRDARERGEARRLLRDVLKSGSARRMDKAYRPELLDDWAEGAGEIAKACEARRLVERLPPLEAAAHDPGDGRELLRLWQACEDVSPEWQELEEVRRVVDVWRPRIEAADEMRRLAESGRAQARTLVDAWRQLLKVGEHPDGERHKDLARKSERRLRCLEQLEKVSDAETEDADLALVGAWKEEEMGDWWEGVPYRLRLVQARDRLARRNALALSLASRASDEEILKVAGELPKGYLTSPATIRELEAAAGRLARIEEVSRALDADPPSDLAIAAAWTACGVAGVQDRLSPDRQERCRLAERRRLALDELRRLPSSLAPDFADLEILRLWREGDLADCQDLTPEERQRGDQAATRDGLWRDLNAALQGRKHGDVRRLMADPLLADYPPFVERRAAMEKELEESAQLGAIFDYLADGGPDAALDSLDLSGVEARPELFRSHADGLRRLLEREIGRAVLREVAPPEIDRGDSGAVRVVRLRLAGWSWRHLGLGERLCLVAAHPDRFLDQPKEGRPLIAGQQSTSMRGVPASTPPGARQVYVTLWPVLRIPSLQIQAVGKPLHRGPFAVAPEEKPAGSLLGRFWKRGARET